MKFKLIDLLFEDELVVSRARVRRLCEQGAISIRGVTIFNAETEFYIRKPFTIKIGNKYHEVV